MKVKDAMTAPVATASPSTTLEGISIVECGGKPNIPLFARVCSATRVPFLVVHDRDAPHSREPIPAER